MPSPNKDPITGPGGNPSFTPFQNEPIAKISASATGNVVAVTKGASAFPYTLGNHRSNFVSGGWNSDGTEKIGNLAEVRPVARISLVEAFRFYAMPPAFYAQAPGVENSIGVDTWTDHRVSYRYKQSAGDGPVVNYDSQSYNPTVIGAPEAYGMTLTQGPASEPTYYQFKSNVAIDKIESTRLLMPFKYDPDPSSGVLGGNAGLISDPAWTTINGAHGFATSMYANVGGVGTEYGTNSVNNITTIGRFILPIDCDVCTNYLRALLPVNNSRSAYNGMQTSLSQKYNYVSAGLSPQYAVYGNDGANFGGAITSEKPGTCNQSASLHPKYRFADVSGNLIPGTLLEAVVIPNGHNVIAAGTDYDPNYGITYGGIDGFAYEFYDNVKESNYGNGMLVNGGTVNVSGGGQIGFVEVGIPALQESWKYSKTPKNGRLTPDGYFRYASRIWDIPKYGNERLCSYWGTTQGFGHSGIVPRMFRLEGIYYRDVGLSFLGNGTVVTPGVQFISGGQGVPGVIMSSTHMLPIPSVGLPGITDALPNPAFDNAGGKPTLGTNKLNHYYQETAACIRPTLTGYENEPNGTQYLAAGNPTLGPLASSTEAVVSYNYRIKRITRGEGDVTMLSDEAIPPRVVGPNGATNAKMLTAFNVKTHANLDLAISNNTMPTKPPAAYEIRSPIFEPQEFSVYRLTSGQPGTGSYNKIDSLSVMGKGLFSPSFIESSPTFAVAVSKAFGVHVSPNGSRLMLGIGIGKNPRILNQPWTAATLPADEPVQISSPIYDYEAIVTFLWTSLNGGSYKTTIPSTGNLLTTATQNVNVVFQPNRLLPGSDPRAYCYWLASHFLAAEGVRAYQYQNIVNDIPYPVTGGYYPMVAGNSTGRWGRIKDDGAWICGGFGGYIKSAELSQTGTTLGNEKCLVRGVPHSAVGVSENLENVVTNKDWNEGIQINYSAPHTTQLTNWPNHVWRGSIGGLNHSHSYPDDINSIDLKVYVENGSNKMYAAAWEPMGQPENTLNQDLLGNNLRTKIGDGYTYLFSSTGTTATQGYYRLTGYSASSPNLKSLWKTSDGVNPDLGPNTTNAWQRTSTNINKLFGGLGPHDVRAGNDISYTGVGPSPIPGSTYIQKIYMVKIQETSFFVFETNNNFTNTGFFQVKVNQINQSLGIEVDDPCIATACSNTGVVVRAKKYLQNLVGFNPLNPTNNADGSGQFGISAYSMSTKDNPHAKYAQVVVTRNGQDYPLYPSDTTNLIDTRYGCFGQAVAISADGDTIAVGNPSECYEPFPQDVPPYEGAVYIFKWENGEYTQTNKITVQRTLPYTSTQTPHIAFGQSLDICGSNLYVGSYQGVYMYEISFSLDGVLACNTSITANSTKQIQTPLEATLSNGTSLSDGVSGTAVQLLTNLHLSSQLSETLLITRLLEISGVSECSSQLAGNATIGGRVQLSSKADSILSISGRLGLTMNQKPKLDLETRFDANFSGVRPITGQVQLSTSFSDVAEDGFRINPFKVDSNIATYTYFDSNLGFTYVNLLALGQRGTSFNTSFGVLTRVGTADPREVSIFEVGKGSVGTFGTAPQRWVKNIGLQQDGTAVNVDWVEGQPPKVS